MASGLPREKSQKPFIYQMTTTDTPRTYAADFAGFPKIARLNRQVIVTEKIDGTNAQIRITEDGQFLVGSR